MTPTAIPPLRLRHQLIQGSQARTPLEVVHTLGAMQGQDYPSLLWAIGLRLSGSTRADIEAAFADQTIVRSWPMRGTLHAVAGSDLRWMLALLAPRRLANTARRDTQLGLDAATYTRARTVLEQALDGTQLTRGEVMQTLDGAGIATTGQRGYHILCHLAQQGTICFGPVAGKQQTFVLLDQWLPPSPSLSREEGLTELVRRYFTGHGPATEVDFVHWSGLTLSDTRRGLALAAGQLRKIDIDGQLHWMAAAATPHPPSPSAFLLPGFDEYLLGYKVRDVVLDPAHAGKVVPGGNGVFKPLMVLDGRVVGTWRKTVKRGAVQIDLEPFETLGAEGAGRFEEQIARYQTFAG